MKTRIDRAAVEGLSRRLEKAGVDTKLVGNVSVDLGDLRDALYKVAELYGRIAAGSPPLQLLDEIESEARDHMAGHVRSLQRTAARIRKGSEGARSGLGAQRRR